MSIYLPQPHLIKRLRTNTSPPLPEKKKKDKPLPLWIQFLHRVLFQHGIPLLCRYQILDGLIFCRQCFRFKFPREDTEAFYSSIGWTTRYIVCFPCEQTNSWNKVMKDRYHYLLCQKKKMEKMEKARSDWFVELKERRSKKRTISSLTFSND